ncbi:DNA primase [candidate division KSB1 bacterium]|nr:DNA primase [candidate division KSB1 bacterium]
MKISDENIEKVKTASDIVEVISGYVNLRQKGQNYFGLCPFHHEKTPSFSVNPAMQIFRCFGCGAGGNVFTFVMKTEGVTFPESVKLLAQQAGILLPEEDVNVEEFREKEALFYANKLAADYFQKSLKTPQANQAREYLASRSLTEQVCEAFDIGYAPDQWDGLIQYSQKYSLKQEILLKAGLLVQKDSGHMYDRFRGRVTFAIRNISGQVVAFGARKIVNDDSPKYINSPETDIYHKRSVLYGLHKSRDAVRREKYALVVEGYTDVISLAKVGVNNTVATSGTALTDDHARLLRRYTPNVVVLYDNDSAGAAAALRGSDILLANGLDVKICMLPPGMDPDEFAREFGRDKVLLYISKAVPLIDFKVRRLNDENIVTARQRAEAVRELVVSVGRVTDSIQQSFLIRDLAEKLQIEEKLLWGELAKHKQSPPVRSTVKQGSEKDNKYFHTKRGAAELGLFQIALIHMENIPEILNVFHPDDFKHPEIRSFFAGLVQSPENRKALQQQYIQRTEDINLAETLAELFFDHEMDNNEKYTHDCILTLKLAQLDEKINEIRKQMLLPPEEQPQKNMEDYLRLLSERRTWEKKEFVPKSKPEEKEL